MNKSAVNTENFCKKKSNIIFFFYSVKKFYETASIEDHKSHTVYFFIYWKNKLCLAMTSMHFIETGESQNSVAEKTKIIP